MFAYSIDMIAEDCWDLHVSDDEGYTWEYFASYESEREARDEAEWISFWVNRNQYISHGK